MPPHLSEVSIKRRQPCGALRYRPTLFNHMPVRIDLPAEFDELSYLELNPDVEAAVLAGSISSGREHWTKYGSQEGRLTTRPERPEGAPPEWNEFNYLRANPDVGAAVRSGGFSSGYEHWLA